MHILVWSVHFSLIFPLTSGHVCKHACSEVCLMRGLTTEKNLHPSRCRDEHLNREASFQSPETLPRLLGFAMFEAELFCNYRVGRIWDLFPRFALYPPSELITFSLLFRTLHSCMSCFSPGPFWYACCTGQYGRCSSLMVSVLDSGLSGLSSSPGWGHCVYSHSASLHPGV